jgi:hypothetical protein
LGTTTRQQANTVGKLSAGEKEESLKCHTRRKAGLSGARPIQTTKGFRHSGSTVDASSRVGARNLNVIKIAEKKQLEDSMSQEPEVGENVKMCQHVLPKPTLNAGCIKISSWTIIRHIKV